MVETLIIAGCVIAIIIFVKVMDIVLNVFSDRTARKLQSIIDEQNSIDNV